VKKIEGKNGKKLYFVVRKAGKLSYGFITRDRNFDTKIWSAELELKFDLRLIELY
jgi:hypothetical protein